MKKIIAILVSLSILSIMLGGCDPADPLRDDLYTLGDIYIWDGGAWVPVVAGGGGDVTGPAGATDDGIARYDGVTGKLIQDSGVTIDNFDNLDTNGGDIYGEDIHAGNDMSVVNDLDVTDNTDIGGILTVDESTILNDDIDWTAGNVTYVPITGNIQTYVTAAAAGDTLILASGKYTITATITVNKQLNIIGQGNAGFATLPVTPSHGTLISCATNAVTAFYITNDNVRIAHLSINMTGDGSTAISTATDLVGIVCTNIDVIVECAGIAQGFNIYGSSAVLRDLTFYVTSTNNVAAGTLAYNDNATTKNMIVDAFNVTGAVVGAATASYAFTCWNNNDANTIELNLAATVARALAGTPLDVAVASYSSTTNNCVVNAYLCTFEGQDYDAYQNGTNQLNLGGSVLVNNLIFGTVTYRASVVSGSLVISGNVNFSGLQIFANNAAAVAGGLVVGDLYRTNGDPDLVCVVH